MTLRDELVLALETENEELRERVRQLEEMLGMTFDAPLQLGLTGTETMVLGLLSKVEMATKEAMLSHLYSDRPNDVPELKIVDVFICKMRRKLQPFGITIDTVWGRGYALPKSAKVRLAELCQ